MINEHFKGFYVFRNPYTSYNHDKSLEFVSSYVNEDIDNKVFTLGFLISLNLVSKDLQTKLLFIENISNNNKIIKLLLEKYKPIKSFTNSYIFIILHICQKKVKIFLHFFNVYIY